MDDFVKQLDFKLGAIYKSKFIIKFWFLGEMITSFVVMKTFSLKWTSCLMPDSFALGQVKMVCGLVEINVCAETSFEIQIRTFSVHYAVKSLDKICWFINLEIGLLAKVTYFDCMIFSLDIHIFWSCVFCRPGVTPVWLLGCMEGIWSWMW